MNSYWMDDEPRFSDRAEAGRMLARQLDGYAGRGDVIVLALPRGGVPVGYEVAQALGVELDVLVVRKLGVPHYPELAMGAIASGGALYLDESEIRRRIVGRAVDSVPKSQKVKQAAVIELNSTRRDLPPRK